MRDADIIFNIEIERLRKEAAQGPLDMDALRRLEILTRSYKNYSGTNLPKDDPEDDLDDKSLEELIRLAQGDLNGSKPSS